MLPTRIHCGYGKHLRIGCRIWHPIVAVITRGSDHDYATIIGIFDSLMKQCCILIDTEAHIDNLHAEIDRLHDALCYIVAVS